MQTKHMHNLKLSAPSFCLRDSTQNFWALHLRHPEQGFSGDSSTFSFPLNSEGFKGNTYLLYNYFRQCQVFSQNLLFFGLFTPLLSLLLWAKQSSPHRKRPQTQCDLHQIFRRLYRCGFHRQAVLLPFFCSRDLL